MILMPHFSADWSVQHHTNAIEANGAKIITALQFVHDPRQVHAKAS
jgi:hypothetical protein